MSKRLPTLALALCAVLAGCGGGDDASIPRQQAEALTTQLDLVADRMDQNPPLCGSARTQLGQLEQKIEGLPASVTQDVRDKLDEGLANLNDLVTQKCEQAQTQEPTTETTETTEPSTTETTETTPPTTTEEQKPPGQKKKDQTDETTTETIPGGEPAPTDGDGGTAAP
jgi:hypothetical protein